MACSTGVLAVWKHTTEVYTWYMFCVSVSTEGLPAREMCPTEHSTTDYTAPGQRRKLASLTWRRKLPVCTYVGTENTFCTMSG